jgi:hypothetical protein
MTIADVNSLKTLYGDQSAGDQSATAQVMASRWSPSDRSASGQRRRPIDLEPILARSGCCASPRPSTTPQAGRFLDAQFAHAFELRPRGREAARARMGIVVRKALHRRDGYADKLLGVARGRTRQAQHRRRIRSNAISAPMRRNTRVADACLIQRHARDYDIASRD